MIKKKLEVVRRSRGLIIGSPNTGKSFLTTQFEEEKVLIFSYPDEKGIKTLPVDKENIEVLVLESKTLPDTASQNDRYAYSMEKYTAVLSLTRQLLRGDYGSADILFLDGLSKLYDTIIDVVTKGSFSTEGKINDPRKDFPQSYQLFRNYLTELYENSFFPFIICTCWENVYDPDFNASEKDKIDHSQKGNRVWLPALPGKMAQLATGEFDWTIRSGYTMPSICTHCKQLDALKRFKEIEKGLHRTYQLLPYDDVQCVGIKGKLIPEGATFIHQSWDLLKSLIT